MQAPLTVLPGPWLPGYYCAYRAFSNYQAWKGTEVGRFLLLEFLNLRRLLQCW